VAGSADFWFGSTKRRPLIGSIVLRTTPMLTFHHFQVFFIKVCFNFISIMERPSFALHPCHARGSTVTTTDASAALSCLLHL
jgi:hypothetical protein